MVVTRYHISENNASIDVDAGFANPNSCIIGFVEWLGDLIGQSGLDNGRKKPNNHQNDQQQNGDCYIAPYFIIRFDNKQ